VDDGVVQVAPATADRGQERAGRLIEEAVAAEDGALWVDPDGTIRYADRHARLSMASAWTIADRWQDDTVGHLDDQQLVTVARHEDAAGEEVDVVDDDAVDRYGVRVWDARDRETRRVEQEALGSWVLFRFAQPSERFDPIRVQPLLAADAAWFAVDVRIGQLVQIEREWPTGGSDDAEGVVEQIEHRIAADAWETRVTVTPHFGDEPWQVVVDTDDEPDDAPALDDGVAAP